MLRRLPVESNAPAAGLAQVEVRKPGLGQVDVADLRKADVGRIPGKGKLSADDFVEMAHGNVDTGLLADREIQIPNSYGDAFRLYDPDLTVGGRYADIAGVQFPDRGRRRRKAYRAVAAEADDDETHFVEQCAVRQALGKVGDGLPLKPQDAVRRVIPVEIVQAKAHHAAVQVSHLLEFQDKGIPLHQIVHFQNLLETGGGHFHADLVVEADRIAATGHKLKAGGITVADRHFAGCGQHRDLDTFLDRIGHFNSRGCAEYPDQGRGVARALHAVANLEKGGAVFQGDAAVVVGVDIGPGYRYRTLGYIRIGGGAEPTLGKIDQVAQDIDICKFQYLRIPVNGELHTRQIVKTGYAEVDAYQIALEGFLPRGR